MSELNKKEIFIYYIKVTWYTLKRVTFKTLMFCTYLFFAALIVFIFLAAVSFLFEGFGDVSSTIPDLVANPWALFHIWPSNKPIALQIALGFGLIFIGTLLVLMVQSLFSGLFKK